MPDSLWHRRAPDTCINRLLLQHGHSLLFNSNVSWPVLLGSPSEKHGEEKRGEKTVYSSYYIIGTHPRVKPSKGSNLCVVGEDESKERWDVGVGEMRGGWRWVETL